MRTTLVVCHLGEKCHSPLTFSWHIPLCGNPTLSHLCTIPDPRLRAVHRVFGLKHIISDGRLMGFSDIKPNLPYSMFFRCLPLRQAVQAQSPVSYYFRVWPYQVAAYLDCVGKPLFSLYLRLSLMYSISSTPAMSGCYFLFDWSFLYTLSLLHKLFST